MRNGRACGTLLGTSFLAFVATSAYGQAAPLLRTVEGLMELGALPRREGQAPFQPTGNPGLPPKESQLPPADEGSKLFRIISSGGWEQTGDVVRITEGAEFDIEGYHVIANEAEGNLRTRVFTLTGDVKVIGAREAIAGEQITVDFRNETYRSINAEAQLPPSTVGGRVRDDVYVGGAESYGNRRETRTINGRFTTCNREDPHYHIEGDDIVLRHGVRAIFRDLRIKVFGRTIIGIPYLAIPLDDRTYRYLPTVGRSPEEGYYIKNRYGVPLKNGNILETREEYMTKLGLGLGLGYRYNGKDVEGSLSGYGITGNIDTLTLENYHRQTFRFGTLTLENNYQRNNYLSAPGNTTYSNRASFDIPQRSGSTRVNLSRQGSDSGSFGSVNQTLGLQDNRAWGKRTRTSLDLTYSGNETRSQTLVQNPDNPDQFDPAELTTERRQLDVRFRGTHELSRATAGLEYQRSIPIGDIPDFFSTSDRTPVLSLASDSRRLFGERFNRFLPLRMEASVGQFVDPNKRLPSNAPVGTIGPDPHIGRANLDVTMGRRELEAGRFQWDVGGRFRQGYYSDDTAQYTLNLNTGVGYRLGHDTSANLRYNYLRPYGFSPLYIDRTGRTNLITADISVRPIRSMILAAETGYDILRAKDPQEGQSPFQQVGMRAEYRPYENVLLRALSTYDTSRESLSNVRFDFTWQPGDTLFSLGVRYDGYEHQLSSANLIIDNLKIGRLRFSTALQYNGFLKRFEAQQYSFIYDLHCAEAVLTVIEQGYGFRSGREIQFFIRLKAFPFDSPFGVGRQGQPLGTGTGRDF